MNLTQMKVLITRPYKTVYDRGDAIVKVFSRNHPKANVFNEALNHARAEEAGLSVPKLLGVSETKEGWAITVEKVEGQTLESLMNEDPANIERYMEWFVDAQIEIERHQAPLMTQLKDKMTREINDQKTLDATTRYELLTRLDSMKTHSKICHGDYNPSNVIVRQDGKLMIIDWSHASRGNASADAALSYLLFAMDDRDKAELYMDQFSRKTDTAKQYIRQWVSLVAAAELRKRTEKEREFFMSWIDVINYSDFTDSMS